MNIQTWWYEQKWKYWNAQAKYYAQEAQEMELESRRAADKADLVREELSSLINEQG